MEFPRLSEFAARNSAGPVIDPDHLDEALQVLEAVKTPEDASRAIATTQLSLALYRPDARLYVAFAMAVERLRLSSGMLEFWSDLLGVLPRNVTVVRMVSRWFRRDRRVPEGITFLLDLFPQAATEAKDAMVAVPGLIELQAFDQIERVATGCLAENPGHDGLRLLYIRYLSGQSQYLRARGQIARLVTRPPVKASDAKLVDETQVMADKLLTFTDDPDVDVVAMIARQLSRDLRVDRDQAETGPISFFTGTLGPGGAEQQLVRIASALQDARNTGRMIGNIHHERESDIVVRSASDEGGDGFFRPLADQHGITVTQLGKMALPEIAEVVGDDARKRTMLELLPDTLRAGTLKLAAHYRKVRPSVAYIWQDGAILDGVVAALLAGVPRIVTSFRGLPPGLRPEFLRPHMVALFAALEDLPQVTMTANSKAVATAYENWLGFRENAVHVIYNVAPKLTREGSDHDHQTWNAIEEASPGCTRTVLGIFRHDQNKQSQLWVEVAAQIAAQIDDIRFVILGHGRKYDENLRLVSQLGMEGRIFLPGIRRNVGYYLHRSELLLHLSRMEGLPNALLEAHICGVPVVTTPAGGAAEVVNHGVTGHILSTALGLEGAEVVGVLIDILAHRDRLAEMGRRAREDCRRPFDLDLILLRTLELFARS